MRVAKADLVPTAANLFDDYDNFAELEVACEAFCAEINARPHRVTRRPPAEMLAEERFPSASAARSPLYGGVRGDPHRRADHGHGRV